MWVVLGLLHGLNIVAWKTKTLMLSSLVSHWLMQLLRDTSDTNAQKIPISHLKTWSEFLWDALYDRHMLKVLLIKACWLTLTSDFA